jgi:hypothetical protein
LDADESRFSGSYKKTDDLLKVSWSVTPAKAGVHPAKSGIEITGFRLSPE